MAQGGKRKGAGRPKGTKGKKGEKTKLRDAASKIFKEKASKMANALLTAQAQEAFGIYTIVRKDETYNKKTKQTTVKWNVVTSNSEIEMVLNEFGDIDERGAIDGVYYIIARDKPNFRASNAILDRAWGKPQQDLKVSGQLTLTQILNGYEEDPK